MPDLVQVADDLKQMPDQWLAMQAQNPSGIVPPYLVVAEMQRRQKLRSSASRAQAPASSVSQDLIRSLQARMPPAQGLPPGSVPPTAPPPGMPPPNLSGNTGGGLGGPAPGGPMPPNNMRMPGPMRMAEGGEIDDDNNDGTDDDEDEQRRLQLLGMPWKIPAPGMPTREEQLRALAPPPAMPSRARYDDPRFDPLPAQDYGTDAFGRKIQSSQMIIPDPYERQREVDISREQANAPPKDVTSPQAMAGYRARALAAAGGEPKALGSLQEEINYLKGQTRQMQPTWQQALAHWGANVAASRSPYVMQAIGQAQLPTLNWAEQQREKAQAMELNRLKVQAQLAEAGDTFRQHIGTEGMRLAELEQRQQEQKQTTALNRYYKANDAVNKAADEIVKQKNAEIERAQKSREATRKPTLDEALVVAKDTSDPTAQANASQWLLDKKNYDQDLAGRKLEDQVKLRQQLARFQQSLQLERDKIQQGYRIDLARQRAITQAESKWTDADRNAEAKRLVVEQAMQTKKNNNGEYVNVADSSPIVDSDGNAITEPTQLLGILKMRAAKNLLNDEYYQDHQHFGFGKNPNAWAERDRVSQRVLAIPASKPMLDSLPVGLVKGPKSLAPKAGTAGTRPSPAAPGAAQAPVTSPAPAAAPPPVAAGVYPASMNVLQEGETGRDDQGRVWYRDPATKAIRQLVKDPVTGKYVP